MSVMTNKADVTVTCGFYDGTDRKYTSAQMSSIFDGVIEDGIYESIGERFVVKAGTGCEVIVGTGKAWFNGTWTINDDPLILPCEPADYLMNRIDAVIIEVDKRESVRDNFIKVITGTAATNPAKPELNTEPDVYQYPLCYIYRPAEVDDITQVYITNCVGVETPFVTGILESRSIDDLLLQWQADLDNFVASEKDDMDAFMTAQEAEFDEWWNGVMAEANAQLSETENFIHGTEQNILTWFDNMKGQLSKDAAMNLQIQLDRNKIEHMLVYGLSSGTKTISEDGRRIETRDSNGYVHTKIYNDDFSQCDVYLAEIYEGEEYPYEIASMHKTFSPDGSTIDTILFIS